MSGKDNYRRDLAPPQHLRWTVMALVTVVGAFAFMSPKFDFSDPVVAGIFVVAMLVVVYAERRWIASSTDEEGRLKIRNVRGS